jgi:hypothetical protein
MVTFVMNKGTQSINTLGIVQSPSFSHLRSVTFGFRSGNAPSTTPQPTHHRIFPSDASPQIGSLNPQPSHIFFF